MSTSHDECLIADIGGTNARFALLTPDGITDRQTLNTTDFDGLAALIDAYTSDTMRPRRAALAVAGPVDGDHVVVTNRRWRCTRAALKKACGFEDLALINDFAAIAWSLPALDVTDYTELGGGAPDPDGPRVVIGPGTGLGVAVVVPAGAGQAIVAGEGGHVTMPAINDEQAAILAKLRVEFGHVSAERLLSGSGLVNIYRAIGGPDAEPEDVTERAREGDKRAIDTLGHFFCWLGVVAGDLALTLGARGGVWLAGGILPKIEAQLIESRFREAFEWKGRFRNYLADVPTRLITSDTPALKGLVRLAQHARNASNA